MCQNYIQKSHFLSCGTAIHRPPRVPPQWRLPGRGIAAFFTPKGHENRNFRRKNDSCPISDNLLFGVFSSFLRVFAPVGTPRICKKVSFSGRNHTRRKDVNLKKTTIILPFFVPPGDESALRQSSESGPFSWSVIRCSRPSNVVKNPTFFSISGHSGRTLRRPP